MDVEKGKGVFFHPPISVVDTEDPDLDFPSTPKSRKVTEYGEVWFQDGLLAFVNPGLSRVPGWST